MKKEKGITLIALVITIIIMLILVVVTINIAVNGGLFVYAGNAAKETEIKKEAEKDYTTLRENMSTYDLIDKYITYGTVYTAYVVGDKVKVVGTNEEFYVIEDSDETKSTVKLLAALNVETDSNSEYYNKQYENASTIAFDSTEPYSNVYVNSTIKPLLDNYVASLGIAIKEGRLMSSDEVIALGVTTYGISSIEDWPTFLKLLDFLLDTSGDKSDWECRIMVTGKAPFNESAVWMADKCGLRPVIVISKANIQ